MATLLSLYKDFDGGQGLGIDNYYTYATDHDSNYNNIEVTVNQLVSEVSAIQGQNAALILDSVLLTDPLGPKGILAEGVMGQHSFKVSIGAPTTELDVARGEAVVNGNRVTMGSGVSIVGPGGGAATHYVALDAVGAPTIEILANQQQLDIARVTWNGSAYTGTVYQEAEILFDGDENAELHRRPKTGDATTPTFPLLDYSAAPGTDNPFRYVSNRILDIEKIIAGIKTGSESGTMGAVGIAGGVAAPGMITTDGSTFDTGTGLYRVSADVLGISIEGAACVRFDLRGSTRQILTQDGGTVANPVFSWVSDEDTGIRFPAAGRLAIVNAGADTLECTAENHIDSATQPRFHVTTTGESLASSGTLSKISMDTEVTDVGGWGSVPGTDWTVPTGADGFYMLTGHVFFDESTANPNQNTGTLRAISISVNGTDVVEGQQEENQNANIDTKIAVAIGITLAAGDVIALEGAQDCAAAAAMDVSAHLSGVKLW